ncbi:histone deacetylase [Salinispira pacifica]|uniref:Histone deacetylase family protein n=1 Tax=Salinispira pacifica TaxID=1307761 RepID=V5WCX5_9SPIO|nr:histone deacetylase [Salinispira pacifica]AHC13668.1 histone deacetylase family protein [Salinispira pacifica]
MQIIYDPSDTLDISDYGIDIPISFNNARKTTELLTEDYRKSAENKAGEKAGENRRMASLPSWYHTELDPPPGTRELSAVHDPAYIGRLLDGGTNLEKEIIRTFELVDEDGNYNRYSPDSAGKNLEELFAVILRRGGGSAKAARLALEKGSAFYFGGGFHHAHYSFGSGFCFYNDMLAAREMLSSPGDAPLTWIIDIDAHKGDGTAELVQRMNEQEDRSVIDLSIHMAQGWPLDLKRIPPGYDADPAWIPAALDIPVFTHAQDQYLPLLRKGLEDMEAMSLKRWGRKTPELAFVVAGADPFEEDELPSTQLLKLSRSTMLERNRLVHGFLMERNIPAAYVQAGNYGNNSWKVYYDFLSELQARER